MLNDKRVLLISPPYAPLHFPSIGLSALAASLETVGIKSRVRYLSLELSDFLTQQDYGLLTDERYFLALVGDWSFSELVYGNDFASDLRYISEVLLGPQYRQFFGADQLGRLLELKRKISTFVDHVIQTLDLSDVCVVGFTSTFQQSMASLALAKRIRDKNPSIPIVMGGANCDGQMGHHLVQVHKYVDFTVSGEGEEVFPVLVEQLVNRSFGDWDGIELDGVWHRGKGGGLIRRTAPRAIVKNMDQLPVPNYADFVKAVASLKRTQVHPMLLLETARGCWWGAIKHCKFCGLNGGSMAFRSKQPYKVDEEIAAIRRYELSSEVLVVDNILDHSYFDTVLKGLNTDPPRLLFHWEVKANLNAWHVSRLAAAGVLRVQPGIESMSTTVLNLLDKGTTAIQNIQLLKLCAEAGVSVAWGVLYGVPGETRAQFDEQVSLFPALVHLQPPGGTHRIRADRFSPYFDRPDQHGVTVQPLPAYAFLGGGRAASVLETAYHFEMKFLGSDASWREAAEAKLSAACSTWKENHAGTSLIEATLSDGSIAIVDRRWGSEKETVLNVAQSAVYRELRTIKSVASLRATHGNPIVDSTLSLLRNQNITFEEDRKVVSLALRDFTTGRAIDDCFITANAPEWLEKQRARFCLSMERDVSEVAHHA